LKEAIFLLWLLLFTFRPEAQVNCEFKQPVITIPFGTGYIDDLNTEELYNYNRVPRSCPTDGHYAYASFTSDCFRGDWHTLQEDHTTGDVDGNMMLVNSSYNTGTFFNTRIEGLKGGTTYEFALWLMNICKPTDKCPFPLLPNITIMLETSSGKMVARFGTGDVERREVPHWTRYRSVFTTPASETTFNLIMVNNKPGGCGNDFALDDITLRECIKKTMVTSTAKKTASIKKQTVKPAPKKTAVVPGKNQVRNKQLEKTKKESLTPVLKSKPPIFPPPPPVLRTRTNSLVKQFETGPGEIRIDLYDNGEIDGDTVSIYHNNSLVIAHAKLSQKPITLRIAINAANPHHELIMVAENLGSIPPNTSLMIVTAGTKRYQVFITSTEQKNAKVSLDLKE
jgi:hypothetical protein